MQSAVDEGVFPGAVLLFGIGENLLFHKAFGFATLHPEKEPLHIDTIFDLASLTKPLATTLGIMGLVEQGLLFLDQSLNELTHSIGLPENSGITLRHLLAHSAGFPPYHPYYLELDRIQGNRKEKLQEWVENTRLIYSPGTQTLYSDLGFILLEKIFEDTAGEDLHVWTTKNIYNPLGLHQMGFRPLEAPGVADPSAYAATEDCPWRKKILRGEVHDENAYAVGGISGQAGLFGTALEIFRLLRAMKKSYDEKQKSEIFNGELVHIFWERQHEGEKTGRALGFDVPAGENSSTGRFFSRNSVGHLGFTGTSFWLDLEKDLIVILLTNRVHPTRANEKIRVFRPLIHDRIIQETF